MKSSGKKFARKRGRDYPASGYGYPGYDIDEKMLSAARANARLAGVDGLIHFQKRMWLIWSHPKKYGFLITNPALWGERLEE